ncbi:MAG TPA: hypothetical protein ENK67_04600 [Flavobacteriia bacterium]|nr:hypothetical protein [Flavobacteriia bacterium]
MEILLNELSLTGQFKDEDEFFNNFDLVLEIIKLIELLEFSIAKEYMFFDVAITPKYKLADFLRLRTDRAKRMKRFLAKLAQHPPFWNEIQKHNCVNDRYIFNGIDVCNSSLAESCERDRTVLSFLHHDFLNNNLSIQKNRMNIDIYNIVDKNNFLEYLLLIAKIEAFSYCKLKFRNSNLNFSKLENEHGFDLLSSKQQENEFIDSFKQFSTMSWHDIMSSDGLQYKKYNGTEFKAENIYKFRVTQKYRCFGYRQEDEFFVLRFEIDHKMSDNG